MATEHSTSASDRGASSSLSQPELARLLRYPAADFSSFWGFARVYRGTADQLIAAGIARPGMFPGLDHPNKSSATFDQKTATEINVSRRKHGFQVTHWHVIKKDASFRSFLAAAQQPLPDEATIGYFDLLMAQLRKDLEMLPPQVCARMANEIHLAAKAAHISDAANVTRCDPWPFRCVTPEQWAALSPKIRRNYDSMLAELIGFQKGGA